MSEASAQNVPATEERSDPLGHAISLTGARDTIKKWTLGAIADWFIYNVAYGATERIAARKNELEGRAIVSRMMAEEVGRQEVADPQKLELARQRFVGEAIRKHENVTAVAERAAQIAQEAPGGDEPVAEDAPKPSQDWMNTLTRVAEDASSEELRDRLARVLASEARKPGTFSKSFIRFIDEVDRDVLAAFQRVVPYVFQDKIPKDETSRDAERFKDGLLLEHEGIIAGASSFLSAEFSISSAGSQMLFDGQTALVFIGEPDKKLTVPTWVLTSLGKQLFELMKPNIPFGSHANFAKCTPKEGLTEIWSGPWVDEGNGQRRAHPMVVHWRKTEEE